MHIFMLLRTQNIQSHIVQILCESERKRYIEGVRASTDYSMQVSKWHVKLHNYLMTQDENVFVWKVYGMAEWKMFDIFAPFSSDFYFAPHDTVIGHGLHHSRLHANFCVIMENCMFYKE